MNDPELVKAVQAYRVKRAQIKARQRQELETELEAWKADVGEGIQRVRSTKHASIEDVGAIIGISNRTFIYDMIGAYRRREALVDTREPDAPVVSEREHETSGRGWDVEYYDGFVKVYIADETYEIPVIDGTPDTPEEWADHSRERRLLYKEILTEIRKHG